MSTSGLVTAANVGVVNITARLADVSGSTRCTVTPASLVSLEITGAASLPRGLTSQFVATGHFSDNTSANLTSQAVWGSSRASVAPISAQGLTTAANVGATNITAVIGNVTGLSTLTVTAAQLTYIQVTPSGNLPRGLTLQLTATGTYTDTSTVNLTQQVTWGTNDTAISSISNAPPFWPTPATLRWRPCITTRHGARST